MSSEAVQIVTDCPAKMDEISDAVCKAARQAVIEHALLGYSVPFWVDGKVVWIPPDEILVKFGYKKEAPKQPEPHHNGK